ncbi:uncharacterized protein BDZ99DRAFT_474219 [Mytilinidion resinicola]|uniref:MYND-type domain-containing protein n=1 Tax=Mytilinidion resinicola TaxID=574789 RepID=A0A6A6YYL6_9PEZI|nr:uncharacterized protein BDZ99DRAFT_474219 [Mytilinidion resinicola]KAF2813589.1 hypothetical protein BDZ99DRAFT_474219 [Mytilinidion resinicola]
MPPKQDLKDPNFFFMEGETIESMDELVQLMLNRMDPNHPASAFFYKEQATNPEFRASLLQILCNKFSKPIVDMIPPARWTEDKGILSFLDDGRQRMLVPRGTKSIADVDISQTLEGWKPTTYYPTGPSISQLCQTCGSMENIRSCSGCNLIRYCSKECQRADWGFHKRYCKRTAGLIPAWCARLDTMRSEETKKFKKDQQPEGDMKVREGDKSKQDGEI